MNIGQINKVIYTEDKNINKNSKSDNNTNDEAMDSREAIAKYLNGVKEYISKITDPLNEMTDEQKERYKQKVLRLIESGKKLNSQQMAYVKKYMPEMYPYVLRIQLKRKAFEESLKHCKSKEEANDIYNRNLSEVNSDEPMAKAMIAAYDDAMKTFKKSDMYKALPDTNKEAVKKNVEADILVEVNVGMEENKFGITVESAYENIKEMAAFPGIHIKGLMTSAPYVSNPEDNRKYFRQLKQLSVDIQSKNIDNVDMGILSMGMTNDYVVAVEEGATIVRVGTAIFGARNYNL